MPETTPTGLRRIAVFGNLAAMSPEPQPVSTTMTTFVLIPGAGGEAAYWRLVAERLHASGDVAISPDLPADDPPRICRLRRCRRRRRNGGGGDTVVVGQSLGAFCAPLVAQRLGPAGSTSSAP